MKRCPRSSLTASAKRFCLWAAAMLSPCTPELESRAMFPHHHRLSLVDGVVDLELPVLLIERDVVVDDWRGNPLRAYSRTQPLTIALQLQRVEARRGAAVASDTERSPD